LGVLYAKAAVTGPLHRGDHLPESRYVLSQQDIDAEHLSRYQRVCGFRVSDVLPPTYLHVLAFPLAVALMTEHRFPFPLIGTVHVANAITVHRPVRAEEAVTIELGAEGLREHPAGWQFDLIADVRVGDETVWSDRSTYLRRGGNRSSRGERRLEDPTPPAGVTRVRVPADIGRRYAAVSGDRNPIHLHDWSAKAFGFPRSIAHGMWTTARTLATLEGRLPDALQLDVAFKRPVLLPSTVTVDAVPLATGFGLSVRNVKSGQPHLTGTVIAR
jgi:acyl dehydratase